MKNTSAKPHPRPAAHKPAAPVAAAADLPVDAPVVQFTPVFMGYYTVGYASYADGTQQFTVFTPGGAQPDQLTYNPNTALGVIGQVWSGLAAGTPIAQLPTPSSRS